MKPAALAAALFLDAIATLHLVRLLFQVEITVGSYQIPMWFSVFGVLGPGLLAAWLWIEQRSLRAGTSAPS